MLARVPHRSPENILARGGLAWLPKIGAFRIVGGSGVGIELSKTLGRRRRLPFAKAQAHTKYIACGAGGNHAGRRDDGDAQVTDASPDPAAGKRPTSAESRRAAVTAGVIIGLSVVAVGFYAWVLLGTSAMSIQGYIALALGIIATLGLGVGLMALVFFSSRYGYDERVGRRGEERGRDRFR